MQSEVIEKSEVKKAWKFPCLGIGSNGASNKIIFFTDFARGFVVNPGKSDDHISSRIGYYYNTWNMDCFTPFEGTVALSND